MATLRDYQQEAVDATYDYLKSHTGLNPCIEVSVGGGKSWIAAQIMKDTVEKWGGRAILLCHVKELLEQDLEKFKILSPDTKAGMYSAGFNRYDMDEPVITAGIQSVYNKAKLFGHRDICLVDECHMIQPGDEGMYGRFVKDLKEINPNVRFIGLTATPYRLKGGLICQPQNLFNEISYTIGLKELIDRGYLSNLVAKSGRSLANLDKVHVRMGEFVADEVEKAMMEREIVDSACREIVELTKDRKSVIIFCSSIAHCKRVASLIEKYSGEECAIVTGDTSAAERADTLKRFKGMAVQTDLFGEKKPLKYVANVECLTTGFDAPNIDCVALLRPTMSPGLLLQMCGRGTRLSPETGKKDCLILDFAGNIERHGCLDQLRPPSESTGERRGPMAKKCPRCQTLLPLNARQCSQCKYEFPVAEKRISIDASASSESPLSGEVRLENFHVIDTTYTPWRKKGANATAPRTVRVTYWMSLTEPISEWICPEHQGFARKRFEDWFNARKVNNAMQPSKSVEEFLQEVKEGHIRPTKEIQVKFVSGERFPTILASIPGEAPKREAEEHILTADEIDDLPF